MGAAIVEGLGASTTDLVGVMDADLSHPPALLPLTGERLNGVDGVIASRYAREGGIADWPARRRLISLVARALARRVIRTPSSDPLSGFFLFRRSSLRGTPLTGHGNKPLFEILARTRLTVYEVPYVFRDRRSGRSKLDLRGILAFMRLTLFLWRTRATAEPGVRGAPEGNAPSSRGP